MAQPLVLYGVAALLLVAGSGPALQGMRDASLEEFADLGESRPLDEFPFLKRVHPYLPPLVVDWIIVQQDGPGDLPPGIDYRFDAKGRVIIVWPDGCEETEEQYREDSECAPPPTCQEDPTQPDCGDPCDGPDPGPGCLPPECPPGTLLDPAWPDADPACVSDPACEGDDNASRPAHCPPPPGTPGCGDGHVEAYDGRCIPAQTTLLAKVDDLGGAESDSRHVSLELMVPFENLSVDVRWTGLATNPYWRITLWEPDSGDTICFERSDGGSDHGDGCSPEYGAGSSLSSAGTAYYSDSVEGPIAAQNLTFRVVYRSSATGDHTLDVRLYGKPYEETDGREDDG